MPLPAMHSPPGRPLASRTFRSLVCTAVAAATALAALAACDPCDDPTGCETGPTLSYTGQLVEHTTGRPVSGVRVQLVRRSGARLASDTVSAVTDDRGFYRLASGAMESGSLVGDVIVTPAPPLQPYRVDGLELQTSTVRGDGGVLGRWVVDPYILFIGELSRRGYTTRLFEAKVTFVRESGIPIDPEVVTAVADSFGRFTLQPRALANGEAVGALVIESPDLPRPVRISGVRMATRHRDEPPQVSGAWTVGPSIRYVGEVYARADQRRLADVEVQFVRRGGANVAPTEFTARTDAAGRFPLLFDYYGNGDELVGDLVFRVPGLSRPDTVRGVRLPVFDTDEVRLLRVFGVGPSLLYVGETFNRGSRRLVPNARVEFRRTGGVATSPDRVVSTSDAVGRFPLVLTPLAEQGDVVGDLTIEAPGLPPVVYRDVRMPVFHNDSVRLLRTFGVGEHLSWAGVLFLRSTGRPPPPGVEVEFRRTGGIRIDPDTFVVRSNDFGGFPLTPSTDEVGEVIGDLVIRPPPPLRPEVRTGIRMRTFEADELRRLDNYGIGPSLQYFGELLRASDGAPIVGARVEFRRTGGIAVTPETIVVESNQDGRFLITPATSEYGDLVGELVVRLPSGRELRFTELRLPTFESDETRLLRSWRVDP